MCVFSPAEGYIYSCCYIDIISREWTLFDDTVHGSFLHSFMIVELHRANSTILRKLKSWSCAIHFAVYVLQYNCFSFANVMHLFLGAEGYLYNTSYRWSPDESTFFLVLFVKHLLIIFEVGMKSQWGKCPVYWSSKNRGSHPCNTISFKISDGWSMVMLWVC